MNYRNDNDLPLIDQVDHTVRESAQQGAASATSGVDHYVCGGLGLDAGKCKADGQKEVVGGTCAALAIPRSCLGDVGASLWCEANFQGHNPSCWRISDSATDHETAEPGFWR